MTFKPPAGLQDVIVAVTGANRGIGRALVLAFAEAGASLLLHARREADLEPVLEAAWEAGANQAVAVHGDLADPELPERLVAAGSPDVLLLNAAVLGPVASFLQTRAQTLTELLEINVTAQFRLARAVLPAMVGRGRGVLVWMSSGIGRFAVPDLTAYCATKHALEGLAKSAAIELGGDGIVSMAVAPGMVRTEMLKAALKGADTSGYTSPQRAGRGFARLVAEALGPQGSGLNGASLDIDRWLPQ